MTIDISIMYCMTMILCAGVLGLSLITYGLTQPRERVLVVSQYGYRGRTIAAGRIDATGRLAEINGARLVLGAMERPGKKVTLIAMK